MATRSKKKHATTRTARPRVSRTGISAAEWQARCELAAAHRLVAHFVFVDLTYNHISARVPGEPGHFLVKADNLLMEQVTASNLVKYDLEGRQVGVSPFKASPAAYNLHAAVLRTRPEINAAVHTHSPANLAVSAQQHGLLPLTQQAMRFYNRIARYPNLTDDTTREGADQLAAAVRPCGWIAAAVLPSALTRPAVPPACTCAHPPALAPSGKACSTRHFGQSPAIPGASKNPPYLKR